MRVAHLSDSHLGYGEFEARDRDSGVNVRELDTYRAFERACATIRDLKPDLLVHSGDLFDHPRPPNLAIVTAFRELSAIARAGIAVVVVVGNHSLPATRGTVCILKAFGAIPGVTSVADRPQVIRAGPAAVLAIPHLSNEKELTAAVEAAQPDPTTRFNLLLLHAGLRGGPPRQWTEAMVPRQLIKAKADHFDYVALGHYHRPLKVAPRAWYAGATERFLGDRARGAKGFLLVDLERSTVEHHAVPTRPTVDLGPIPCNGLDPPDIVRAIAEASREVAFGAIVRVTLAGLSKEVSERLNAEDLRKAAGSALHLDLRLRRMPGRRRAQVERWRPASLAEQFQTYAEQKVEDPQLLKGVLEMAKIYLDRAKEHSLE